MRTWMTMGLVVALSAVGSPAGAFGGLAETTAAAGIQGTLAGSGVASAGATIGAVRSSLGSSVSRHNQALVSAVGSGAPRNVGSGAVWMTTNSGEVKGSEGWATLTGGIGGTGGWASAEPFGGAGAADAWGTSSDAWATGGMLPQ